MPESPNPTQDSPANPALEQALQTLYGSAPRVPPELDAWILTHARQALNQRRPASLILNRPLFRPVLALAATLALAASLALWFIPRSPLPPTARSVALPGDIDGDGRVDIVDAMVLATALQHPIPGLTPRDINGDGVIDQADVDALGLLAVRLDGGGT